MYDTGVQALEFGAFGKFFDTILHGVSAVKNIKKKDVKQLKELGADLTKLTAAGAVIAGAATQAKTETTSDNQQNNTISNITENK